MANAIPIELTKLQVVTLLPGTAPAFVKYFSVCHTDILNDILKVVFAVADVHELWMDVAKFYLDAHGRVTCLVEDAKKSSSVKLMWDISTQSWDDDRPSAWR